MIIPANPGFEAIYGDDENKMTRQPVIAWYFVNDCYDDPPVPVTTFGLMPQPTAIQFPDGRVGKSFFQTFDSFYEADRALDIRPALDLVTP